jgi:hypothetical protein
MIDCGCGAILCQEEIDCLQCFSCGQRFMSGREARKRARRERVAAKQPSLFDVKISPGGAG